jgi:hypothetical protein
MRFVALALAIATLGAGVGFVSVAPAQAHGGDGGGPVEIMGGYPSCTVVVNVENTAIASTSTCNDLLDSK